MFWCLSAPFSTQCQLLLAIYSIDILVVHLVPLLPELSPYHSIPIGSLCLCNALYRPAKLAVISQPPLVSEYGSRYSNQLRRPTLGESLVLHKELYRSYPFIGRCRIFRGVPLVHQGQAHCQPRSS